MRLKFLIIPAFLCGACTQFPELDASLSPKAKASDFPDLVPLEPLLAARTAPSAPRGPEIAADVSSRVSALQSRAARLRGSVLSQSDRARLGQRPAL